MESPYNRPMAANLIENAIKDHERLMCLEGWCGYSREMFIYSYLKRAGYLTEEAMIPDED